MAAATEQQGLVRFESNADIEQREADELRAKQLLKQTRVGNLSAYISRCWEAARDAKTDIRERLLDCRRRRRAEYSDTKLSAIEEEGGSVVFKPLTRAKCIAAEAWMRDILAPAQDHPWTMTSTPIPELPPDEAQRVVESALRVFIEERMKGNMSIGPADVYQMASEVSDRVLALNYGKLLAIGTAAQVQRDPAVISAYLGN